MNYRFSRHQYVIKNSVSEMKLIIENEILSSIGKYIVIYQYKYSCLSRLDLYFVMKISLKNNVYVLT